jgi:large subunit ribosomal protein L4
MAKLNVTDLAGASLGEIEVADDVFAVEVKEHLLWEVVRYQRAARRAGTHSTKTRAEVHLTGKKMTKQKGTGGARHGSRRSNIFRGGGSVHGPQPRKLRLQRQQEGHGRRAPLGADLRAQKGDLLVVREFALPEIKTKALFQALTKPQRPQGADRRQRRQQEPAHQRQNLATASFLDVRGLNVYDILRFPKLLISETSLRAIEARLNKSAKSPASARRPKAA